ncbi:MAG: matrixin family metalloprotease [Saccharospirillaceae bacterium]|nr:M10 family metallopeptidase domain-containing protein [Pseudomonadales bacterium]NRB80073.1 matrixin family metalloprotease [Saccharospirillaceae bacterium]
MNNNLKKISLLSVTALSSLLLHNSLYAAQTGRQLDVIKYSGPVVSLPSQGGAEFESAEIVGIFWDQRCAQIDYTYNSNSKVLNQFGEEIAQQDVTNAIESAMNSWNANPSSYINLSLTNQTQLGDRPHVLGDFINELVFVNDESLPFLAYSPSAALNFDTTFVAGDDIDGDGDSDVYDPNLIASNVCMDIDQDGDIEFPAGDYKAGTILDNDIQFNAYYPWEIAATGDWAFIVEGVALHELGHSIGLSHSSINIFSDEDGTGAVMFPSIDISLNSKKSQVKLTSDELSASAFLYPEGSAQAGIAAIQDGDIKFEDAYDVISGTVTNAGQPQLGGSVKIFDENTGRIIAETYTGQSRLFWELFETPEGDVFYDLNIYEESAVNGDYQVAVPKNTQVTALLEALDWAPVYAGQVSTNAYLGAALGQISFPEEGYDGADESDVEFRTFAKVPFHSSTPEAKNINFKTNEEIKIYNWEQVDYLADYVVWGAQKFSYVEMFDRQRLKDLFAKGLVPVSGSFQTNSEDKSLVPVFESFQLVLGKLDESGNVQITKVIREEINFIGQDKDDAPFYFENPKALPFLITNEFNKDPELNLFMVLNAQPTVFDDYGIPPNLVAWDEDVQGFSFLSLDDSPIFPYWGTWAANMHFTQNDEINEFLVKSAELP